MTGLKYASHGINAMDRIREFIPEEYLLDGKIAPSDYRIRLINCDFRTGCEIKRERLCRLIQSTRDIFCNYELCIYPGVKIQYNFNNLTLEKKTGYVRVTRCVLERATEMVMAVANASLLLCFNRDASS